MINARQLEVLNTVIEVGTTLRASEVLGVSQPAVSNMIRHTEDLIGIPLFERSKGRLTPTKEAIYIAQEAQHLFMQQKRVDRIIAELRDGQRGTLFIAASPSIGLGLLPRVLGAFTEGRENLKISLELGSIDTISDLLASGRADIGFSITTPRHPSVSHHQIRTGALVLICPPDHPYASSKSLRITDLNETSHISYSDRTPLGQLIDKAYAEAGLERRYNYEVRHTATALEMVASGLGVALVDSFALAGRSPQNVVTVPLEPIIPVHLTAMTSRLFPTPGIASAFLASVRSFGTDSRKQD